MFAADAVRCMRRGNGGGGGQPAESPKFWRINITKTRDTGAFEASLTEVEFRSTVGGDSSSVGGVAFASSEYIATYAASKAFDGNANSLWLADYNVSLPQYIGYQHVDGVDVVEIMIQGPSDSSSSVGRAPEDFTVDYSVDGASWTTALTVTGEPSWSVGEIRTYVL